VVSDHATAGELLMIFLNYLPQETTKKVMVKLLKDVQRMCEYSNEKIDTGPIEELIGALEYEIEKGVSIHCTIKSVVFSLYKRAVAR